MDFSACVFRESASLSGLFFACTDEKVALSLALSLIIDSYLKLNTTSRLNLGEKNIWSGRDTRVARDTQHMMNTFMSEVSENFRCSLHVACPPSPARRVYFYRSLIFSTLTKKH